MDKIRTIDQGNSHPHVGIYYQGRLEQVLPVEEFLDMDFAQDEGQILALSSVGPESEVLDTLKGQWCDFKSHRSDQAFAEMPIHYGQTLGEDRLYQAYYLYEKFCKGERGQSVMLIDAGTFSTFDLINKDGFQGGIIVPGEKTYFDSFEKGANLPVIPYAAHLLDEENFPQNTEEAIVVGRRWLLEGLFSKVVSEYHADLVIFTGGQGKLIHNLLNETRDTPPMTFIPHLIHDALHYMAKKFPPTKEGSEA